MTIITYILIGFVTAIGTASFICYDEITRYGKKSLDDIGGYVVPASLAAGLFWPLTLLTVFVMLIVALPIVLGYFIAGLTLMVKNKLKNK